MAFADETFTVGGDTFLDALTGWNRHTPSTTSNAAKAFTASGRAYPTTSGNALYYHSGAPATADYTVSCLFNIQSNLGIAGVAGRIDTAATTFYAFAYSTSLGKYVLYKKVSGTTTILASSAATPAGTVTIALDLAGTTVRGLVNGSALLSATDATITAAGKAGLWWNTGAIPSSTTAWQADAFTAVDAGAAAALPPPLTGGRKRDSTRTNDATRTNVGSGAHAGGRGNDTGGSAGDTTPPVVSAVTAFPGTTSVTVTWTTNEPATSQVEYGTTAGYGSTTTADNRLVTTHSVTFTNLVPSTLYHYRVKSADGVLNLTTDSDRTTTTTAVADTTAPIITGGSVLVQVTDTSARISWDTDEASTSVIDYGTTATYGTTVTSTALVTHHDVTITGLTGSTIYFFQVHSLDPAGNDSAPVADQLQTAAAVDTAPPTFSGIAVAALSSTSVRLSWTTNEPADTAVEYGATTAYGIASVTTDTNPRVTSHAVTLTGLSSSTTYHWRPLGTDAAGNAGAGTDQTFATPAPSTLVGFVIGPLTLTPLMRSIEVTVPILSGSVPANINVAAPATVRYKPSSEPNQTWSLPNGGWRAGFELEWANYNLFPITGTVKDAGQELNHKLVALAAATAYDVEVTVRDGLGHQDVLTATVTTRADAIPAASSLTVTHYLDPAGSDANNGTAIGTPWKTVSKAWASASAPGGAVVEMAPGDYYAQDLIRSLNAGPITLKARNPVVTNSPAHGKDLTLEADGSKISRVYYGVVGATGNGTTRNKPLLTGPAASGAPYEAPWLAVSAITGAAGTSVDPSAAAFTQKYNAFNYADFSTTGTVPSRSVWVWRDVGFKGFSTSLFWRGGYSATRWGEPMALHKWNNDATYVTNSAVDPAKWAEFVETNIDFNSGFCVVPRTANTWDVYLIMPGGIDPNTVWISFGGSTSLQIKAPDCRVTGVEFRSQGPVIQPWPGADRTIVDHCVGYTCYELFSPHGISTVTPHTYSRFGICQYSAFIDTGAGWSNDHATLKTPPWNVIKRYAYAKHYADGTVASITGGGTTSRTITFSTTGQTAAGAAGQTGFGTWTTNEWAGHKILFSLDPNTTYTVASNTASSVTITGLGTASTVAVAGNTFGMGRQVGNRLLDNVETHICGGSGGGQYGTMRGLYSRGAFNGLGNGQQANFDHNAGRGNDWLSSFVTDCADDAYELDAQNINGWVDDCIGQNTGTMFSTAPLQCGPGIWSRCRAWRWGSHGVRKSGHLIDAQGLGSTGIKYGHDSTPFPLIQVVHCTFWTDRGPNADPNLDSKIVHGAAQFSSGSPSLVERFRFRNTVVRVTGNIAPPTIQSNAEGPQWTEDYNAFASSDATRGLVYGGATYSSITAYRTASGQGAHTNAAGGDFALAGTGAAAIDAALTNPTGGDLTPGAGSRFIDAGTPCPCISDRAGVDYTTAPDLGYQP